MNNPLEPKSVCVISPKFFGYEKDIVDELRKDGKRVTWINETISSGFFIKSLVRLGFKSLISNFIKKYYDNELVKKVHLFDHLFIINPETIDDKTLEECKKNNPHLRITVYMWDSVRNKPNCLSLLEVSDDFFTFDPQDADDYKIKFLPLFYVKEYEDVLSENEVKYSLSFIGTAHSERSSLVKKIFKGREKTFSFFYCPNFLVFLYKKYFKNELASLSYSEVSTKSMSRSDIVDVVECSNAIVDISHPEQVGLTMRTLEMFGANKKIITTNKNITSYDFYHPNNILVFDESLSFEDIDYFLSLPYVKKNLSVYNNYSLRNWLLSILDFQ